MRFLHTADWHLGRTTLAYRGMELPVSPLQDSRRRMNRPHLWGNDHDATRFD